MPLPRLPKTILIVLLLVTAVLATLYFFSNNTRVDFNADVKPILNKNCITCHGGVRRQGGFSVLFREEALAKNKSGKVAIIPGDPENSELIKRLSLTDPEERMPYKHPALSNNEITILKNWIKQGANWGDHWAYTPVQAPQVPHNGVGPFGLLWKPGFIKNELDQYIYQSIKKQGLTTSNEADKATLLRRVSLDITGMPATYALAENYLKDQSEKAYEHLVDTLLASPSYGERWAAVWMDLARYADTKGYERDDSRTIWRYRDWLINAFNENKPYDRFLIEQLAGDLLPNPTDAQFIATAFHRNTLTNDEGGTDNEEFRTAAVVDRVNTTWSAIMGTTFNCVQCHSHPYDPFKHDEYYKFMAFFNNSRDEDTYSEYPLLREFHKEDSTKFVELKQWLQTNAPSREKELSLFLKTGSPAINSIAADELTNSALADTKWLVLRNNAIARLKEVSLTNYTQLYYRYKAWNPNGVWLIHLDKPDGAVISKIKVPDTKGAWKINQLNIPATVGKHHLYFTYSNSALKTPEESGMQFDWFYFSNPFPGKGLPGYDSAYKHFEELFNPTKVTYTPIMVENPTDLYRPTHVFIKGNWLVKGKEVQADVPASLIPFPANAPRNRLGLAQWLTDKKNPLTARTMVNRIWEQFFGQGIVETLEDMGSQGMAPTHRELLDYLSWKLMNEYQWDLKKLMKHILMSATYRQQSNFNKESVEKDPYNKFYARGPRVRLSAEQLRDQSLLVSGLISNKMYGPGVMPFQPEGIWMSPYNRAAWKTSDSVDQYRRALYTYWKRSAPYPSMISFDGTSREGCTVRRIRTNTPLQALTSLNDSVNVEAAQHFAWRIQSIVKKDPIAQINKGYELAMFQTISTDKRNAFEKLYQTALNKFRADNKKMRAITGPKIEHQTPETAALIMVAAAMMNTDEFITKN